MTESGQRIRAVAQVSDDPRAAGPAILMPRRRPGHLGSVHILQLLLVEAAVVAILATLDQGTLAIAAAVAGAVLVLVISLARRKGRWWLERRLIIRRYQRRRRFTPARSGDDPRLAALRALVPGLQVEDVPAADGARVGVARDGSGWFAVAAVKPRAPMRDDPGGRLPLDLLAGALADLGQPGAVLQVVRHAVPAFGLDISPASPASQSYRQLLTGFGAMPIPKDQVTWIAVRLDATSLAEADANAEAHLDRVPAVVAALVRGVTKSLRWAGVRGQVLDSAGLIGALARSCDLDAPTGAPTPTETWTEWNSARLAHRVFWIRDWPPVERAGALLNWLTNVPAAATNVALILMPDDDRGLIDMRCLVRVSAPAGQLDQVCQAIVDGADQADADLFPLDGEQGPAVYASAPSGGGPR